MIQEKGTIPHHPGGQVPDRSTRVQHLEAEIALHESLAAVSEMCSKFPLPEGLTEEQLAVERVRRTDDLFSILESEKRLRKLRKELRRLSPRIHTPPGSHLARFADFIFSKRVYETVFVPVLRDIFDEYCEALNRGRLWKAKWVCLRGHWSFWSAVLAQAPVSAVKLVYKIWRAIS